MNWYLFFRLFFAKNRVTKKEIVRRIVANNNKAPGLFSVRKLKIVDEEEGYRDLSAGAFRLHTPVVMLFSKNSRVTYCTKEKS